MEVDMSLVQKQSYARQLIADANEIAALKRKISDRYGVYFDRGYNSGGSDEIVDADVADLNVTAAQISSWITLLEQWGKFWDNQAVTTGDYDATMNALRQDI
jgi:hypothetical protein